MLRQGPQHLPARAGQADVPTYAVLLAFDLVCAGLVPTIGVVALTLNLPNEIRGRGIATYVLTTALAAATGPAAIALVSQALGGEAMLGHAIVVVAGPAALLSAGCFVLAMRADAVRRLAAA